MAYLLRYTTSSGSQASLWACFIAYLLRYTISSGSQLILWACYMAYLLRYTISSDSQVGLWACFITYLLRYTISSGSQVSLWACFWLSITLALSLLLIGNLSIGQSVKKEIDYAIIRHRSIILSWNALISNTKIFMLIILKLCK